MGDERHKRPYPTGPRKEMTPKWKDDVRDALEANLQANRYPRDQVELAESVGLGKNGKTAISKMLGPRSVASKLVVPVSATLCIDLPMVATPPPLDAKRTRLNQKLEKMTEAQVDKVLGIVDEIVPDQT